MNNTKQFEQIQCESKRETGSQGDRVKEREEMENIGFCFVKAIFSMQ